MRKLLFTILPLFLLLITVDVSQAQSAREALNGNWTLTDIYMTGENKLNRDADGTAAARQDLIDKHQLEYHFTVDRLSIAIDGETAFMYYHTIGDDGRIEIDEPLNDAFPLMWNLEMVKLDAGTLVLKCDGPDNNNKYVYQVFSRN